MTPLYICAMKGFTEICEFLISKGSDANIGNNNGNNNYIIAYSFLK